MERSCREGASTILLLPNEDSNGPGICAFFHNEHLVPCSAEGDFADDAGFTEFLGAKIFESRNDAAVCCYSDELQKEMALGMALRTTRKTLTHLDLRSTNPTYGR